MTLDFEAEEERSGYQQRIAALETRIEKMTIGRTDAGLNVLSLQAATQIEDQFAMHHPGGRNQRLAKCQLIIREAMREIIQGEKDWRSWTPNTFLAPLEKPE